MSDRDRSSPNVLLRRSTPAYLAVGLGVVGCLAGGGLALMGLSAGGAEGLAAVAAILAVVGGGFLFAHGGLLALVGWHGLRTDSPRVAATFSLWTVGTVAALVGLGSVFLGIVSGAVGAGVGYAWSRAIERATGGSPGRLDHPDHADSPRRDDYRRGDDPVRGEDAPIRREDAPVRREDDPIGRERDPVRREGDPGRQEDAPARREDDGSRIGDRRDDDPARREDGRHEKEFERDG